MHERTRLLAVVALSPLLFASASVNAQPQSAPGTNADQRLEQLERRLDEMDKRHAEELRARDEEIARLRAHPPEQAAAAPTTWPATTQSSPEIAQSALDRAISELRATPSAAQPGPEISMPPGMASGSAQQTALPTGDIVSQRIGGANLRLIDVSFDALMAAGGSSEKDSELGNLEGGDHDPRKNGFTVQNTELSFSGAIDPYFGGEAHIVYLIDPATGESRFELEEAFLVTQRLPYNLQVKAGQFFTEFGRINPRHPHQWEFMDQPIINTRLFGPDGMRGPGVRLSWLAPLPWYSDLYVGIQNANGETMASFLSAEDLFAERAIGGRPFVARDGNAFNSLVYTVRWENGFDLSDEWSTAIGVSGLVGPNATGPDGQTYIYGIDLTVKWRPERNHRGFPYFLWQSEAMGRTYRADNFNDGTTVLAGSTLEDWGFYTQGIYGFMPGWRGGLRFDYATGSGDSIGGSGNDPFRDDRYRLSPLLEWLPSEFSRVRFQVNYDHADHLEDKDAISFWIGFEYLIGAHAAHKY